MTDLTLEEMAMLADKCVFEILTKRVKELETKCARYEKTLKQYAEKGNWGDITCNYKDFAAPDFTMTKITFRQNGYELAQKALGDK